MKRHTSKKRFRKFRKRKSILKSRFFRDFALFSVLAILAFYFLFLSEVFRIKEAQISAPENVPKKEIQALLERELRTPFLYFFHQDTFFLVNSKKIEEKILREYLEIKEANLEKRFPGKLILEIKKREPAAQICSNSDNCFLIDSTGIIYTGQPRVNLALIFREGREGEIKTLGEPGKQVIFEEKMSQLLEIQDKLEKNLQIDVEKFTLREGERLDVKTIDGWEIYFDLSGDTKLALTKLELLLEKEIPLEARKNLEYIDLRFSKVYYK